MTGNNKYNCQKHGYNVFLSFLNFQLKVENGTENSKYNLIQTSNSNFINEKLSQIFVISPCQITLLSNYDYL